MIKNLEFIEVKDLFAKKFYNTSVLMVLWAVYSHGAMRQVCRCLVENHCAEFTAIGGQHDVWHLICDEVCAFVYNNDDEHYVLTSSYEDCTKENIESWTLTTPLEKAIVVVDDMNNVSYIKKLIEEVRGEV